MEKITIVSKEELSKVKDNVMNAQQLDFMLSKTPVNHIYERPAKGGGKWQYVTGTYMKKVLNLMFGWNWDFEVVEYKYDLEIGQVFVLGKLTCRTGDAKIIKTQFGRQDIKFRNDYVTEKGQKKKIKTKIPLDLGNDLKAATTDCLKKCASELGIASDIYAPQEFKEIKVVAGDQTENLKKRISELLDENQDEEEKQQFIDMITDKEATNEATSEFYQNIIENILEHKLNKAQ